MKDTAALLEFETALQKLNALQRQAVESIEGPVMVIAGPGTGKTQILTLRIANILLKTDTRPENILALTFTDSGAKAMRERLRRYIGTTAYRVPIYTFHGFAEHLIGRYPEAFPRIIGGRAATDIEKVSIIERIISSREIKLLRPLGNHTYYVSPLISIIGKLKQENISPDGLNEIIAADEVTLSGLEKVHQKGAHKGKVRGEYSTLEKVIAKNRELQYVYRAYEATLRAEGLYDFDDMILETVSALQGDESFLLELQETFQYVLADEHQDVNGSQNKILELLTNFHQTPNIFVVGDEKQAIYRFQGASLGNFLHFTDIFKETKIITLSDNYRSGQAILDAAHTLIRTEDEDLAKLRIPLKAAVTEKSSPSWREFSHQVVEDDWLTTAIKDELSAGVMAHEIAVIVRTNREVETIAALLRKSGVSVTASADSDILEHPITEVVSSLMMAVVADKNERALFNVIHGAYWGLSLDDVIRITSARSFENSLSSILSDKALLDSLGVVQVGVAMKILEVIESARTREVHEAPHRVLEYLLRESGLLDHLIKYDPYDGVRVVRRLFDEIEAMVMRDKVATLKQVCEVFTLRRQYGLPLSAPYLATNTSAVAVMTAHKSKGLEFNTVFIPHMNDAAWGGKVKRSLFKVPLARFNKPTTEDDNDDEQRLLYVAMTRAKRSLFLSTSALSIQGKSLLTSRLLTPSVMETLVVTDTSGFEKEFSPVTALGPLPDVAFDTDLIRERLLKRGLSATALNNLMKNPWDFFYRNILRVPEIQPLHMQFGTAIHGVLEKVTNFHTKHKNWPTITEVKEWLERSLSRLPVNDEEYARLHEKALSHLIVYLEHLEATVEYDTKEEFSVRVTLPLSGIEGLPEITLTGKIDRLDFSPDGELIKVVDYKTGSPKSRGHIEGLIAGSDGGYKRQLAFYALLLELYGEERLLTRTGVLSFVEPDTHGKIREELFTISDEEILALKQEIQTEIASLLTGKFFTDVKLAEASEYSDLAMAIVNRSK